METRHTQKNGALVPIGEAARRLGVVPETVRRWEAAGKIASVRTSGGQRRFALAEIERVNAGGVVESELAEVES